MPLQRNESTDTAEWIKVARGIPVPLKNLTKKVVAPAATTVDPSSISHLMPRPSMLSNEVDPLGMAKRHVLDRAKHNYNAAAVGAMNGVYKGGTPEAIARLVGTKPSTAASMMGAGISGVLGATRGLSELHGLPTVANLAALGDKANSYMSRTGTRGHVGSLIGSALSKLGANPRDMNKASANIQEWAGGLDKEATLRHTTFQGLPITVENPKGSVREGVDKDGHKWKTTMKLPYGCIEGTKAKDGEGVDVFLGPDKKAPTAYVVHQHKADGTGFDEDKVMLGQPSKTEAVKAYLAHYDDPKFLGPVSEVPMQSLRKQVNSGKVLTKISAMRKMQEALTKTAGVGWDLHGYKKDPKDHPAGKTDDDLEDSWDRRDAARIKTPFDRLSSLGYKVHHQEAQPVYKHTTDFAYSATPKEVRMSRPQLRSFLNEYATAVSSPKAKISPEERKTTQALIDKGNFLLKQKNFLFARAEYE